MKRYDQLFKDCIKQVLVKTRKNVPQQLSRNAPSVGGHPEQEQVGAISGVGLADGSSEIARDPMGPFVTHGHPRPRR